MTTPGANGSRIAAALVVLLAIPFDPDWIDFEAARRGVLWLALGLVAIASPAAFDRRAIGDRWLLLLAAWMGLGAIANASSLVAFDAVARCGAWCAMWLLWRAGANADQRAISGAAAWALVVAAVVGVAQRVGVPCWIGGPDEPVSLFGNRNVAAEFVSVAGAVVAARRADRPTLSLVALLLAGLYATANGSRSGLVALPLGGMAAAAWDCSGASRLARLRGTIAPVVIGMALGLALPSGNVGAIAAAPLPGATTRTETLEVRVEIAKGALRMAMDAPLIGHGPGQFQVVYPRYRSQREIELSSLGRTEMRRVGTAHDDWLETAVEGGAAALLLLLAFFVARLRQRDAAAAPLVALAALMLVRAPLGNAPAVALALLASSRPLGAALSAHASAGSSALARRALGLALALLGSTILAGSTCVARFVESAASEPDVAWLERATSLSPFDPTSWQLLANERARAAKSRADAESALEAANRAVALRPDEPSYRLLRADLLRMCGRTREARADIAAVAKLDPGEPQTQIQLAGLYATEGNFDAALVALATDPPPALRAVLATQIDELASAAEAASNPEAGSRLRAEAAFVRALDAMREATPRSDLLAKARFDEAKSLFAAARMESDIRPLALLAALSLRTGQGGIAESAGDLATKRASTLAPWQWMLLREVAEPLRSVASWSALLPKD